MHFARTRLPSQRLPERRCLPRNDWQVPPRPRVETSCLSNSPWFIQGLIKNLRKWPEPDLPMLPRGPACYPRRPTLFPVLMAYESWVTEWETRASNVATHNWLVRSTLFRTNESEPWSERSRTEWSKLATGVDRQNPGRKSGGSCEAASYRLPGNKRGRGLSERACIAKRTQRYIHMQVVLLLSPCTCT